MHSPQDRIYRREMTRRDFLWLAGATSATLTAPALLSGCATNPVTGERNLVGMSEQDEVQVDRQHAPHQYSADFGAAQDDALNRYVADVGAGMWARSHRPNMPYSARVVNANYINAYTFPGGSMAATRGILLEMQNEDELAALMGHEIGHVNARHAAQRAGQGMLAQIAVTSVAIAAELSDYRALAPIVQIGGQIGASAMLASYSRDHERQADALGLEYMTKQGYNPEGMVGLMNMLRRQSGEKPGLLETMFSSHPMSSERYDTAVRDANTKYAASKQARIRRERYMDNTARLRRMKPAIDAEQRGEAALSKKAVGEAEQHFNQALGIAPDDYTGLVLMAKTQLAQKRTQDADRYLERARAIYPTEGQALQMGGIVKLALRQPDAAFQRFDAYDKALPGNAGSLFFKGVALENMQNQRGAAQHYAAFLKAGAQGEQAQYAQQRLKQWGVIK